MIYSLEGTPPDIGFPDTQQAETDPNGLLAIGGDLSTDRLVEAYRRGIFPWFSDDQPILWWSPAPRMVLYPDELHVSRSLRKSIRKRSYTLSLDRAFPAVIRACASPRADSEGTWLVNPMIDAYRRLYEAGIAHSFEVWSGGELVGGLYGIALGRVFFGESMFSAKTDASKVALTLLVQIARRHPFDLIDCQVYTAHLASLGARELSRMTFEAQLREAVDAPTPPLQPFASRPASELLSSS